MLPFELSLHVLDHELEATKTPCKLLKCCSLDKVLARRAVEIDGLHVEILCEINHLKLSADGWHYKIGFVEGAEPPVFRLHSLTVDHFVFPPLLEFLLPALSHLASVSVGLDECEEDGHVEAVLAMLYTCRSNLIKLVLTIVEYYGKLCKCCCNNLILSLPPTVHSRFFYAEPFDTISTMFSETLFAEDHFRSSGGLPLLTALERFEVPIKGKKLLSKRELDCAEAEGVIVRGFKFLTLH
ncbi:hypothetical protein JCM10207_004227 [Rhodosporidiobolus poonsookiae]